MDVKGYLKKNKEKIKYGSITLGVAALFYTIGKYSGAAKSSIIFRESLLTFLSKEDYKKFCEHFDDFHNITRG